METNGNFLDRKIQGTIHSSIRISPRRFRHAASVGNIHFITSKNFVDILKTRDKSNG